MSATKMTELYSQYPADQYNVLYPSESIVSLSKLQQVSYELIRVNPDPKSGDVFSIGKTKVEAPDGRETWIDKLNFGKTVLARFASSAGIQVDPTQSGLRATGNPAVVQYECVGAMLKPDGSWQTAKATKTIDLDLLRDKQLFKLEGDLDKGYITEFRKVAGKEKKQEHVFKNDDEGKKEIQRRLKEFMFAEREHKEAKAETKAFNRLVRAILGLKPWYTAEELKKPFVVVRIGLDIDFVMADPAMKARAIEASLASRLSMFGERSLPAGGEVKQIAAPIIIPETDDERKLEAEEAVMVSTQPQLQPAADDSLSNPSIELLIESLKQAPEKGRVELIETWISRKGFLPAPKSRLPKEMTIDEQEGYIKYLYKLPDPEAKKEVAPLPF